MKTLLQLNSSLHGQEGASSQLSQRFVTAWRERNPDGRVVLRDLAAEPVPHLTAERFQAFLTSPEERDTEQQAMVACSDGLIEELRQTDTIALGLPMYNFGIPSTLKAYFDHIARAGVTFRYTENGPEGLLRGKNAVVFAARGGRYAGTDKDTQTAYVRDFLAFIGITEVEFVYAEGLAMGDESRERALSGAYRAIRRFDGERLAA